MEGIAEYAGLKASDGIPGFEAGRHDEEISFDGDTLARRKMQALTDGGYSLNDDEEALLSEWG